MEDNDNVQLPYYINHFQDNDYEEEQSDEILIDDEEYNNNLYDRIYDIYNRMNKFVKDYGLNLLDKHTLDNFIKFYLSETGNKFLSEDTH